MAAYNKNIVMEHEHYYRTKIALLQRVTLLLHLIEQGEHYYRAKVTCGERKKQENMGNGKIKRNRATTPNKRSTTKRTDDLGRIYVSEKEREVRRRPYILLNVMNIVDFIELGKLS